MDIEKQHEETADRAAQGILGPNPFVGFSTEDIAKTLGALGREVAAHPMLAVEQQADLAREFITILAGQSDAMPEPGDKRFADTAWHENPLYARLASTYVTWEKSLNDLIDKTTFTDVTKERARFIASLWTGALAPSNWLINPTAVKRAVDTGGGSFVKGAQNMLSDLMHNGGMPSQVDKSAFVVGKNIGVSVGSVVWRNDVLELIQYGALTDEVYTRPTMIIPPQINKFYVFDLAPGRSLVEQLVKAGITTFCVSWRNPTADQRDWGLDTYVAALDEALAVVREICSVENINVMGACSGAMTQSALLGYYAATGQASLINAATMLVAVLESTNDTTIGLFATPQTVAAAKASSAAKGVLDGQAMGRIFAWLRPNDLIWNYWVNNYLLGNPPPAFDILYWNNDTTRLSAKFHAEVIDLSVNNTFRSGIDVLGKRIDLGTVDVDKYVVAGITDHIAPWKGAYNTMRMFGGKSKMILSAAGHIQSLINPPGNKKSRYYTNEARPEHAEAWLEGAAVTAGSWWDDWASWTVERSGEKKPAPSELGSQAHPPIVPSPGTYVFE